MSANFKAGQILTAEGLNEAINSILPGRRSTVATGGQASVRQNVAPSLVLEPDRPVYLDKASMLLAAGEPEGWYVQQEGKMVYLPKVKANAPVYMVISTDVFGLEIAREWMSSPPPAYPWDPVSCEYGQVVHYMGRTAENPFIKSGPGSRRFIFYPVSRSEVDVELVSYMAPATPEHVKEFPLLGEKVGNTQPMRVIQSGGGLIQVPPASGTAATNPLPLAPRVSLFNLNDESCAPGTGFVEELSTLRLGEWIPLARLKVAGQEVVLHGYWVTPWRVGLSFSPSELDVVGSLEKMTWHGHTPVVGEEVDGVGRWKRVSYTPGVTVLKAPGEPLDCNYEIHDYAVYEAPGTYAPSSYPPGTGVDAVRRVLWVAQMRRVRYPQPGPWEQFDSTELTAPVT